MLVRHLSICFDEYVLLNSLLQISLSAFLLKHSIYVLYIFYYFYTCKNLFSIYYTLYIFFKYYNHHTATFYFFFHKFYIYLYTCIYIYRYYLIKVLIFQYLQQQQSQSGSGFIQNIFLPSDPDELVDQLKLLYFEKVGGNDNPMFSEQIVAIIDKLLEYECITTNQHQNISSSFS